MPKGLLVPAELQVGERLRVETTFGTSLGRGTYIWNGLILLDSGQTIRQEKCRWEPASPDPIPAFKIYLDSPVRAFHRDGGLYPSGGVLGANQFVTIEQIDTVGWNHGDYLAAQFFDARDRELWVLVSELGLPEIKAPHLRVVAG